MIIDSHAHVTLPVETMLAVMRNENIDLTVLCSTVIHPELATTYADYKEVLAQLHQIIGGNINPIEARRQASLELQRVLNEYPGKFVGFGNCPIGMPLPDTAGWIQEQFIDLSFKGIGEITIRPGLAEQAENLFKAISDHPGYPLWFHTFAPLTGQDIRVILTLAEHHPRVPVILGHGGGCFWLETLEACAHLENVFWDISGSFTTCSIKSAAELMPERVLFSSDMPYNHPAVIKKMVETSIESPTVKAMVMGENMRRLLNI